MDAGLAYELELARNLATAYIATEQGIGLDYARKKYAEQPVGEFWISLARMVIEQLGNRGVPEPRSPRTIQ
jgi:hypothetical protein